jgi:hypothetical protein
VGRTIDIHIRGFIVYICGKNDRSTPHNMMIYCEYSIVGERLVDVSNDTADRRRRIFTSHTSLQRRQQLQLLLTSKVYAIPPSGVATGTPPSCIIAGSTQDSSTTADSDATEDGDGDGDVDNDSLASIGEGGSRKGASCSAMTTPSLLRTTSAMACNCLFENSVNKIIIDIDIDIVNTGIQYVRLSAAHYL